MLMPDKVSKGRAMMGLGCGLAQIKYDGFGIDMAESRYRMNESAAMIIDALESGLWKAVYRRRWPLL